MSKIPTHLQSIINIINNYEFVYENNYVNTNINAYVEIGELNELINQYQNVLNTSTEITDEEKQQYIDAINDLKLAVSELER